MALPTDPAEAFVREVDENLRRDQMADMAKSYGKWIVVAVILFLAAVGGFLYWQTYQQKKAKAEAETVSAALDKVASGNLKGAQAELTSLSTSSNDVTRASALLGRAATALRQNDRKTAAELYKQVEADDGLPQPYRDLATVRRTMTEYDNLKPDEVIARLAPLSQPGNPFFGSAGEMTGLAMLAKGDRNGAGQLFAKIAADKQVPQSIRGRAVQLAGSLGVDATASMPVDLTATPAQ
ncbi:tetratricopeptide repeat protein [Sphingomonas sp. RB56-2]|uniref:Tetratricopeptide repeat protein n=1 Tax=Sphingomonas brevis TaxID=2908206 RepID=A0ABT0S5U8_9SPHN|nr:tetratricopeptide repeat protein [Sphingomonas brevis]MCL6739544.1 tetratricopeptide repeat protein [Sphingomonas brevis]